MTLTKSYRFLGTESCFYDMLTYEVYVHQSGPKFPAPPYPGHEVRQAVQCTRPNATMLLAAGRKMPSAWV